MSLLASLMLAVVLPQGATPPPQNGGTETPPNGKPALLTPAEQESLHKALAKFIEADTAYRNATMGNERDKLSKKKDKLKADFEEEFDKHKKKHASLLASMADMRAMFDNCFLVKNAPVSPGSLRKETIEEQSGKIDYYYYLPKAYKPATPCRTVLAIPGTTAPNGTQWTKPADWFTTLFDKTNLVSDTLVLVCSIPDDKVDLDPIPDYTRQGAEDDETKRRDLVLGPLGDMARSRTYNLDRARMFLDAGRGGCGFALRLMTMSPDRFAGAVLRLPSEVDDLRLGSLTGSNLLLLRTPETAAVVDALKKRLDESAAGSATVLDATDAYPHPGSAAAIEAWMKERKRNMVPTKVVLEPNHDRFNMGYWVDIVTADSLLTAPADKKPRLEVEADRKANRIVVKAVGVERFRLLLNDDLVDLDKEFTVVVNDKPFSEKRTRSFSNMYDRVIERGDWEYLFPVEIATITPKE